MDFKIEARPFNGFCVISGLSKADLDLDKTLDCGQAFRWRHKVSDHPYWEGVIGGRLVNVMAHSRVDGSYEIVTDYPYELRDEFIKYFALDIDFNLDNLELNGYERRAFEHGRGIRILRQDFWEAMVSFIISQRNSIPRISNTIEKLCRVYGKPLLKSNGEVSKDRWRFPRAEEIYEDTSKLYTIGLGYRAEYIEKLVKDIVEHRCNILSMNLDEIETSLLDALLQSIKGIGPKVSNCILLFGCGRYEVFPIDTWITKVIYEHFGGTFNSKRDGKFAGLVQQYLFYYARYSNE